jgi:ubiquinone/menaquinone biosynthesis C-methylase UbiE
LNFKLIQPLCPSDALGTSPLKGEKEDKNMSRFLNPSSVIAQTGISQGQVVADLGCGNGFYSLPAAQMTGSSGSVIAVDVVENKLEATISIAKQFGLKNIEILKADLEKPLLAIAENSCDLVILGNILHQINEKEMLIKNAYRILKTGGRLLAIEWKRTATPFGPEINRRIEQQTLEIIMMQMGFKKIREIESDNYHYAMLFEK